MFLSILMVLITCVAGKMTKSDGQCCTNVYLLAVCMPAT